MIPIDILSGQEAPDTQQVLQGVPNAGSQAASAVAQAPVSQPTLAPPSLWKSVLMGALAGIATGAQAKTFSEGAGRGVGGALQQQQQQKQTDMQAQQFATQQQEANQRLAMLQAANHRAAMEHPSTPEEITESTMLQGQKVAANLKLNGVAVEKSFGSLDDAQTYMAADHNINPNSPFSLQAYPNANGGIDVFRLRDLNKPLDHETDVVTGYTVGMGKDGKPSWDAPPVAQIRHVFPGQMTIGEYLSSELNAHNKFDDARLKVTGEQAKAQSALQNKIALADATGVTAKNVAAANAPRGGNKPVYAYDPQTKETVLTNAEDAAARGLQAVRPVTQAHIASDEHNTSVLNDVALKTNAVIDSAKALDQDQRQKDVISWALGEDGIKIGFGDHLALPMDALVNNSLKARNLGQATTLTKQYIIGILSLRESAMGMNRVLTGSARASESQIKALQATLPGY